MWRHYLNIWTTLLCVLQVHGFTGYVTLRDDGPTVQGGSIIFRADLYNYDGSRPSGEFRYTWTDNGVPGHSYESPQTENTTSIWKVDYPPAFYPVGEYSVEVIVSQWHLIFWRIEDSQHKRFEITEFLNGNISISQSNHTLTDSYVSSAAESKIKIDMRKNDEDYIIKNATSISTYWFVDCKYYGQTNNFTFGFNFTRPDETKSIEALVIASHEPPTTVPPTTTSTTPIPPSNITTAKPTTTTTSKPTSTLKPSWQNYSSIDLGKNISLPYVCFNSSSVLADPKKTYGYFHRDIYVRAPIRNITVEGTNWIKPWEMLNLSVSCQGSGPFFKCLEVHPGTYNVTGNETCDDGEQITTCNFSIVHFFLKANVYTILVILKNNVSTTVYPLTINIYEVTAKPQLSVIVVPVSCSLAAVVLIVFGIAYYIQSRAKFTVEVADFDFGQNNPDMEYKTFRERLRDSFNSTGYKPLTDPTASQT
uniref:TMEM130 protein n=1 Tax=Fopius arisanus TaxID=64838 RepID=A0A0C9QXJ7_9HYME